MNTNQTTYDGWDGCPTNSATEVLESRTSTTKAETTTEVETKEDYILYLQSVIDDKDEVIENQMNQIKKLLGLLANSKKE